MKRTIKTLLAFAIVAVLSIISVSAANVTLNLEEFSASDNQYEVYAYYTAEGGVLNTLTVKFTYNTEKLILADSSDFSAIANPTTAADAPIYLPSITVGRNTYKFSVPSNGGAVWTENGTNKIQGYITAYTDNGSVFGDTDVQVFSVAFLLADGVTPEDIYPEDFVIDYIYVSDTELGEFGYNTTVDYITQVPEFTNNVVTEKPSTPEASILKVSPGDTVYFADGTVVTYEEEIPVTVPAVAGIMYINNGYTSHFVYSVDQYGVITHIEDLNYAVLGMDGAGIRTSGVQGIRFRASASNSAKELTASANGYEIMEYGFLVTAETAVTGLKDVDYTLDMALVKAGKAKTGVAYNKADGTNIVYESDPERTIFTNVVKNIPMNKTSLESIIASRPYYLLTDGENVITVYGEITKRSIYEVAKAIKQANGTDYTSNKAYIDEIITTVDGAQTAELTTEIKLDVSFLYE